MGLFLGIIIISIPMVSLQEFTVHILVILSILWCLGGLLLAIGMQKLCRASIIASIPTTEYVLVAIGITLFSIISMWCTQSYLNFSLLGAIFVLFIAGGSMIIIFLASAVKSFINYRTKPFLYITTYGTAMLISTSINFYLQGKNFWLITLLYTTSAIIFFIFNKSLEESIEFTYTPKKPTDALPLREDIQLLEALKDYTNNVIRNTIQLIGSSKIPVLFEEFTVQEISKNFTLTQQYEIDTSSGINEILKSSEKESIKKLISVFYNFNTKLISLYSSLSSEEITKKLLSDVFIQLPSKQQDILYKYGIVLGLAIDEKLKINCLSKIFENIYEDICGRVSLSTTQHISNILKENISEIGTVTFEKNLQKFRFFSDTDLKKVQLYFGDMLIQTYNFIKNEISGKVFLNIIAENILYISDISIKTEFLEKIPYISAALTPSLLLGKIYLIEEEKPVNCYKLFNTLVDFGFQGMCISRVHPSYLSSNYNIKNIIWLSKKPGANTLSPTNIVKIVHKIDMFLEKYKHCVVLFEGLEYLVSNNGFETVINAFEDINDTVMQTKTIFLVSINPKLYDEKNYALFKRNSEVLSYMT